MKILCDYSKTELWEIIKLECFRESKETLDKISVDRGGHTTECDCLNIVLIDFLAFKEKIFMLRKRFGFFNSPQRV